MSSPTNFFLWNTTTKYASDVKPSICSYDSVKLLKALVARNPQKHQIEKSKAREMFQNVLVEPSQN